MPEWIYPNQNYSYDPYHDRIAPGPVPPFPTNPFPAFPFPIAPYPNYDSEEGYEQDLRYLVSLYPDFVRPMIEQVRIAVERYDRPGSFLSDRYPDKESILRIVTEIYDALSESMEGIPWEGMADPMESRRQPQSSDSVSNSNGSNRTASEWPDIRFTKDPRNPWLLSLLQILFSNELLHRRQSTRRKNRYWFGY